MYITTFYSFKGGVGRSMAMVNIAMQLVKQNLRVLIVDFDLEAPGLDTFPLPEPVRQVKEKNGIVEYVTNYIETNKSPNVEDYIYELSCSKISSDGCLWMMPAGKRDSSYALRLNSISWTNLYNDHNGYLFFEDLKKQWEEILNPDYVLIDSRTGHTDVGGICTRQLPNAVVTLFFPNKQNLLGLEKVVKNIRQESEEPRKKEIAIHFVTSNVPDIDDEDEILKDQIAEFQKKLNYDEGKTAIIHHYNSLSLLNQVIFTLNRQRSRLAKEYTRVMEMIRRENIKDRDGVLDFLTSDEPIKILINSGVTYLENKLQQIKENHSSNGKVLYRLANVYQSFGTYEEVMQFYNQAIEKGYSDPDIYLRRVYLRLKQKSSELEIEESLNDIKEALAFNNIKPHKILQAFSYVIRLDIDADAILYLMSCVKKQDLRSRIKRNLVLDLIRVARFNDAMKIISLERPQPKDLNIEDAFNYAMAEWAESSVPSEDLFMRVAELENDSEETPNNKQCMAITYWALNKNNKAQENINIAKQLIEKQEFDELSAWRYATVSRRQFIEDLNALEEAIQSQNKNILPMFMSKEIQRKKK